MKTILCYGDSNTYGINPDWVKTGVFIRHGMDVRWPMRLQTLLGQDWRILEEGLNGRTTVFDDPTFPGRSGLEFFRVCLESHAPLDGVIIMLGTNDTKPMFGASPMEIATGLGRLIQCAKDPFLSSFGSPKKILIACPVPLGMAATKFIGDAAQVEKSKKLAPAFEMIARQYGCDFIDLAPIAKTAPEEGIHLPAEAHAAIADAMAAKLREMFAE